MAQDQTQKQEESTMTVMLWTGGALLIVALLAIYAAM
jgi:heme/copper-type cytochrome/quinol oxidase subunit 2